MAHETGCNLEWDSCGQREGKDSLPCHRMPKNKNQQG